MKARAIRVPASLFADLKKAARAVQNGLDAAAKGVQADLNATVRTWDRRVDFEIAAPKPDRREIFTEDPIWSMLNEGTKPHIIRPKNKKVLTWIGANYRPKSRRRFLGANKGGNDNTIVYAKEVQHPGTAPREWTEVAGDKWDAEFPTVMQRAIDSEVEA